MRRIHSPLRILAMVVLGGSALALGACGDTAANPSGARQATMPADASAPASSGCPVAAATAGGSGGSACPVGSGTCEGDCKGDCEGCQGVPAAAGAASACVCAAGKAGEPVWCEKCDVGYVDGAKAGCRGCVDTAQKKAAEATTGE